MNQAHLNPGQDADVPFNTLGTYYMLMDIFRGTQKRVQINMKN